MTYTVAQLAEELGAELIGDGTAQVRGLGTLKSAAPDQLAFLANPRYRPQLAATRAAAVLCTAEAQADCPVPALVVKDPYLAFARLSGHFDPTPVAAPGVHPRAVIAPDAVLSDNVSIGPNVVIEAGVRIGAGAVIMANCVVGAGCELAEQVTLFPNVTIYHGVSIGPRTIIHAGSVIGADGFGYAFGEGRWNRVAQVGAVRIGADVEIGANVTVDRGAIDDTVIGNGVILDDQVHLGHNVTVGDHTALAGKVGVSGSTRIGSYCMIGGAAGLAGHLEIGDKVMILGMTLVSKSISEPGTYGSSLTVDRQARWQRNAARFRHLDDLFRRVRKLEQNRD
ncbi:UDP-3-O-(3-hydroxymyristoyl)glucosamine N-acyltransferase [Alcanivorax sp. JB21]|uniref:UDP-3-O-(3-hydroxymyristoyl)glucosamine N-acyltransferase n=1 Tax=Alcanivorax limicola TaxID=2874102 RepID=UPI001CBF0D64|nr:UDP-3-O-(3-hydroxymyristoyl)glucosamine N-acyltransferase [Alcanivorax limicola]MBZ2188394.1 UDP-3-O-(3-hydroxymyristoyl)glucosamine N-acyltransferase [Alcanivorax limicola]